MADLLRRDGLPALEKLCLKWNPRVRDKGVVALAEALQEAPRTLLVELGLRNVGMHDSGMTALASSVRQGRIQRMKDLDLSNAPKVTDRGIMALTQAINARGLPNVQQINMERLHRKKVTAVGCGALAQAFVNGCPRLKEIHMPRPRKHAAFLQAMIKGMLWAAGRTVSVHMLPS